MQEEIEIPHFHKIDTDSGLMHMAENKELYLKILHDFYHHYKDLDLSNLSEDEFIREIHTIKSLSASIGAKTLYAITKGLDKRVDKRLLPTFYKELNLVIDELKIIQNQKKASDILPIITPKKRDYLFEKLKEALENAIPRECNESMNALQQYKLNISDERVLQQIQLHLDIFDFDEASALLQA